MGAMAFCWQKITGKCSCKQNVEGPDGTCKKFSCWHNIFLVSGLLLLASFLGGFVIYGKYKEVSRWGIPNVVEEQLSFPATSPAPNYIETAVPSPMHQPTPVSMQSSVDNESKDKHGEPCPHGSGALPKGLVQRSSDLEMRSLWGNPIQEEQRKTPHNLLAIPVGIKQKDNVNKMVQKFPADNFTVMLFHYDGVIDKWSEFKWTETAIHVAAINQTKWWFAKRFLHPDIIDLYNYIFIWDEDLGVNNFHADRYLAIMEEEGLEISQPALDTSHADVHYGITKRNPRTRVHRRMYKNGGGHPCLANSIAPPCTGWVEMMAPVFSRAAWRCSWGMIQNDLVHGWGMDMKLGYCAQGDRTKKVGIIDSEYILHQGIPSLGGIHDQNVSSFGVPDNTRLEVRKRSYIEMEIFKQRWAKAVDDDDCWIDPYLEVKG
jgi:hypothetical protein